MEIAPEYVAARRVLLDALAALNQHVHTLVLVGAQAVYHHTGEAELSVPLMTTDADLAINTADLSDVPEIGGLMRGAGFQPGANPGHWVNSGDVAIDLMVVPHQANTSKATARAAKLAPHEKKTARIARGLEPALIDNELVAICGFNGDDRSCDLRIAGPAALLTAKAIKIGERLGQSERQPDRLKAKDALDAFRILQAIETEALVEGFALHAKDDQASAVSQEALEIYRAHASTPDAVLPRLASVAASGDRTIAPSFAALVGDLLDAL